MPYWLHAVLQWLLPRGDLGESVLGDFHEEYPAANPNAWARLFFAGRAVAIAVNLAVFRTLYPRPRRRALPLHLTSESPMRSLLIDLRDAVRSLRRRPLFTISSALLLALGLGAAATVFSFVDAVLLRPLPLIENLDRVVRVQERAVKPKPGQLEWRNVRAPEMRELEQNRQSIVASAAVMDGAQMILHTGESSEHVATIAVTSGFFATVGVQPYLGRPLQRDDEGATAPKVVLLSYEAWNGRFARDPKIIGRQVTLAENSYTVIGVMPKGFSFPSRAEFYLPLKSHPFTDRFHVATGLVLLKPAATLSQAQAEVRAVLDGLEAEAPTGDHGSEIRLRLWRDVAADPIRGALQLLALAAALLLILATANLSGLLGARNTARHRELAVRRSLGASPRRIAQLLIAEGLLIGIVGAVIATAVCAVLLNLVVGLSPEELPFRDAIHVDWRVMVVTASLALVAGTIASLVPLLAKGRDSFVGTRVSTAGGVTAKLFVVSQVAAATLILACASALARSLIAAMQVDYGVRVDGVATMELSLPRRYRSAHDQQLFFDMLSDSLAAIPGVNGVAHGLLKPMKGGFPGAVTLEDDPRKHMVSVMPVSAGYFEVLRYRAEIGALPRVGDTSFVVLTRTAANRLWPNATAIGKSLAYQDRSLVVTAVINDQRKAKLGESEPDVGVFLPFNVTEFGAATYVLRYEGPTAQLNIAARGALQRLDPQLAFRTVTTLASVAEEAIAQPKFYAAVMGTFAAIAFGLAVAGLYAVIVFSVRRRMKEFGIRLALGARPTDNLRGVLREGLLLGASGAIFGSVSALMTMGLLADMLYRIRPRDPVSLVVAMAIVMFATAVAALTPAVTASRADPMTAIRAE